MASVMKWVSRRDSTGMILPEKSNSPEFKFAITSDEGKIPKRNSIPKSCVSHPQTNDENPLGTPS
jgi:hypothetical protein